MPDDNLGPAEPWQIKAFPRELRKRVTADAVAAGLSVGEHLTRLILNANGHAAPTTRAVSVADLRDLVQTAAAMQQASGQTMSKRAAHRLYGFVDDQVRAAAGLPARKIQVAPRITGPDSAAAGESDVRPPLPA